MLLNISNLRRLRRFLGDTVLFPYEIGRKVVLLQLLHLLLFLLLVLLVGAAAVLLSCTVVVVFKQDHGRLVLMAFVGAAHTVQIDVIWWVAVVLVLEKHHSCVGGVCQVQFAIATAVVVVVVVSLLVLSKLVMGVRLMIKREEGLWVG